METFASNRVLNEKEISERKVKLDSFAQRLIVTLSSRCNLNCIMCEVRKSEWDIPRPVLEEISRLFPYLESIIWQGGEPFLLDYFSEIFDRAAKFPHLKQMIVTNGLLITKAWAEELVKHNVELTFSIDGITKETYEYVRRRAKFEDVLRSLKLVKDARKKFNSGKLSLRLHAVVMKSNYRQLPGFLDFAHEYGMDAVHFIAMWGSQAREEDIFYNQEKEALHYIDNLRGKLEEKARRFNIDLLNALPSSIENQGFAMQKGKSSSSDGFSCQAPWQQLNIDPGGGVRPGCLCLRTVGSVLENSLSALWNNDSMQDYRKRVMEKDFGPICNQTCLSVQTQELLKKYRGC